VKKFSLKPFQEKVSPLAVSHSVHFWQCVLHTCPKREYPSIFSHMWLHGMGLSGNASGLYKIPFQQYKADQKLRFCQSSEIIL